MNSHHSAANGCTRVGHEVGLIRSADLSEQRKPGILVVTPCCVDLCLIGGCSSGGVGLARSGVRCLRIERTLMKQVPPSARSPRSNIKIAILPIAILS